MTALMLDSVGPNTDPAAPGMAREMRGKTTMHSEPVTMVDQSSVLGRMQRKEGKKPLWLPAPIAIVAAGAVTYMASQNSSARNPQPTATTSTHTIATAPATPATP